jgi:uncharacterized protein (DUF2267 family)
MASSDDIVQRVRELGPFADRTTAKSALETTLELVGELLTPDEAASFARALPPGLSQIVHRARPLGVGTTDELVHRIAAREGVRSSMALEHAECVLRALGEILEPEARARLGHALPTLGEWLAPRSVTAPEGPERTSATSAHAPPDLAEGRPGGTHPLAGADPTLLGHRHSIARNADPHADTKLSSAPGLSQERAGQTLASGTGGSRRPVSSGH